LPGGGKGTAAGHSDHTGVSFIGGQCRTLASDAKIRLHAYRMETGQAIIVTIARREQGRDRSWFVEAGVAPWFVERMFDTHSDGMLWSTSGQVLPAGVVQQTSCSRRHARYRAMSVMSFTGKLRR